MADVELVIVLRERLETTSLDLDSVVNVGTSIDLAIRNRHGHVRAFTDAPGNADWGGGDECVRLHVVVEERSST